MVGLYKDPEGENIFKNTQIGSRSVITTKDRPFQSENNYEVPELRKRIKQLEDENDVCIM